jgi:hypothetical protein
MNVPHVHLQDYSVVTCYLVRLRSYRKLGVRVITAVVNINQNLTQLHASSLKLRIT